MRKDITFERLKLLIISRLKRKKLRLYDNKDNEYIISIFFIVFNNLKYKYYEYINIYISIKHKKVFLILN